MGGNRLAVLDGLRGIAILLVVWFHIWQISWLAAPLPMFQFIPEGGFLGVDIFFFISGFVICYPFVRAKLEGKPRPTWAHFYYRRAIKIVPSFILSIAVVYAIGYAATQGGGGDVFRDIVTHLFFVHNWFAPTYGSINGVLWTLAVEVQFYCLFPLIAPVFFRWPYYTATAMIAIAMAFRIQVSHGNSYYFGQLIEQLPAYLDVFACGMVSSWLYVQLRNKDTQTLTVRAVATAAAILGFIVLVALMENLFSIRYNENGFGTWKIINRTWLALDCGLITLGSLFAFEAWKRVLGNPIFVFCSLISYNWYIYHQVVARELWWHHLPPWEGTDPHFDPHWQFWYSVIAFPLTIVVATLVTFLFERPILRIDPAWWQRFRYKSL